MSISDAAFRVSLQFYRYWFFRALRSVLPLLFLGKEAHSDDFFRGRNLVIPAEVAGVEFDFLKFYAVAVDFHLVVNPSHVRKVARLINLT